MNEIMTVRAEAASGGTVTGSRPRIHTARTVSAPATPPAATFVVGAIDGCVIACRFPAIALLPLLLGGYSWSQRLVFLSVWLIRAVVSPIRCCFLPSDLLGRTCDTVSACAGRF